MSLENLDDITDDELVAAGVDLDDPDSIDAFLEGREQPEREEAEPEPEQDEEQGDTSGQAQTEKPEPESEEPAATDSEESEQEDEPAYVATKDGKGKIPYEVLKAKREEVSTLRNQMQEMQSKLDAAEAKSKQASTALEKHGIDISALEQGETLTDEQLEELEDIDPSMAKMARMTMAMYEKMEGMKAPEPEQNVSPERQAALSNPDIAQWIDGKDDDRFDFAVTVDQKVRQDPKFQNASLDEIYAEVAKRTKAAFGDSPTENKSRDKAPTAAEKAAEKVAEAEQQGKTPTSLSHMGKSPSTEKSIGQQLSGLSEDELVDKMMAGKISDEQLEAALDELGFQ